MDVIDKLEITITAAFILAAIVIVGGAPQRESLVVGIFSLWVFFYLIMGFVGFRYWRINHLIPLAFFGLYWFSATVLLTILFRIQGWEPLTEMIMMSLFVLLLGLVPMGLYVYLQRRRKAPLHPQYFRLPAFRTGISLAALILVALF